MDNPKELTHVGLCAGYGGIELGLKRVLPTLRTVALCEIEAFACANLVAKMEAGFMDPAPIWTDLKTFPWEGFQDRVDVLTGGYPCQPFSAAGQRKGADDPRHLWPFISAGIAAMRPRLCFFENVEGHISLGLPDVIEDLGRLGYRTTWGIFSAAEVGAPHQRKRVFILAHRSDEGLQRDIARLFVQSGRQVPSRSTAGSGGPSGSGELADSDSAGGRQDWQSSQPRATCAEQSSCFERRGDAGEVRERQAWPSRAGEPQHAWEPPRVVVDSQSQRAKHGQQLCVTKCGQGRELLCESDESGESLGNTESGARLGRASGNEGHAAQPNEAGSEQKTQPTLGGDADGAAGGLDDAELCVTCDNCTDELRLLGNGVVPATAALAFETLARELFL